MRLQKTAGPEPGLDLVGSAIRIWSDAHGSRAGNSILGAPNR